MGSKNFAGALACISILFFSIAFISWIFSCNQFAVASESASEGCGEIVLASITLGILHYCALVGYV